MWSDAKRSILVICLLPIFCVLLFSNCYGVKAQEPPDNSAVYLLEMPVEYINYTICQVNGKFWAKVDGTYPINKINIEPEGDDFFSTDVVPAFSGEALFMIYPTPPGTTNISIKVDQTELAWSNYTQSFPEAVHYTALGNWSMISCNLEPVLDEFTLKIHYEHPIQQNNESYSFLYDINIIPYLSPWSNKSTAYFSVKFETEIADFNAVTITPEGNSKSVEYTTQKNSTDPVLLQVVSEYSKPLKGDLLITFSSNETAENEHSILDSNGLLDQIVVFLAVGIFAGVGLLGFWFFKRTRS